MATTSPIRIDDEIHASAKLVAEVQSRSTAQQIAHWARIGREVESSASVSHVRIAEVLSGRRKYDELDNEEQAVVRAEWGERAAQRRSELNLAVVFAEQGRSWVELDDDGTVVHQSGTSDQA